MKLYDLERPSTLPVSTAVARVRGAECPTQWLTVAPTGGHQGTSVSAAVRSAAGRTALAVKGMPFGGARNEQATRINGVAGSPPRGRPV